MNIRKITFLYLIFLLLGCGKERHTQNAAKKALPVVDTANAAATWKQLKDLDPVMVDSAYAGIASDLTDEKRFPLLQQHLTYYRKIAGATERVRAVEALTNGFYYAHIASRDSANLFFSEAIRLYTRLRRPMELAVAYLEQTGNYMYQGDYARALANQYKALAMYEQQKDSAGIYRVRTHMLQVLIEQREFTRAIDLAQANIAYYTRYRNPEMLSHNEGIISSCYYKMKRDRESLDHAEAALRYARECGNELYISECMNNLALAYSGLGNWEKATATIRESLVIIQQKESKGAVITAEYNLATAMWKLGKRDSAMKMFDTLITQAAKYGEIADVVAIYKTLYVIHREERKFEQAMNYLRLYHQWRDSVHTTEKEHTIHELDIKYETAQKQDQINQLRAEKKADTFKNIAYLTALIFTIISATLAVLFLRSRNKKNQLLVEKVQLELAGNKRELEHFTESILLKNKFIKELEQKLTAITEQTVVADDNSEQLSELYQFKILTEDDWREFKKRFDKVYPGLINRLRSSYPDLSPAEERQFLLIRLNIENKECADMLGISGLSVKKNRYRLKKRFNLAEQDNLDEFVKSF